MLNDIRNYSLNELHDLFKEIGKEKYRSKQVFAWLYQKCVDSFDSMTDLNKDLRKYLNVNFKIGSLKKNQVLKSKIDNSKKYLFETFDGHFIEGVVIPEKERQTVCISSQIGCLMGCAFCATSRVKFVRNLTMSEIISQTIFIQMDLFKEKKRITNIVFMGMGEPLLNLDNVIRASEIFHSEAGFHLGRKKITISTCGIVPGILEMAKHRYKLAVSLNSSYDTTRNALMPINKKYPLIELKEAVKKYYARSKNNFIVFEYILFKNVNTTNEEINKLVKFVKSIGYNSKINLIDYNEVNAGNFSRCGEDETLKILYYLNSKKIRTTRRMSKGKDINGACGQLAGRVKGVNRIEI